MLEQKLVVRIESWLGSWCWHGDNLTIRERRFPAFGSPYTLIEEVSFSSFCRVAASSNYAINPTPEQCLSENRAFAVGAGYCGVLWAYL